MATNRSGYFDPAQVVSTIYATPDEQAALLASWRDSLDAIANGTANGIPMPPIHSAYLPPGWSREGGRYLPTLPIERIIRGELSQQWWFGDPLWDQGRGQHNGYPLVASPPRAPANAPSPDAADAPVDPRPSPPPRPAAAPAPAQGRSVAQTWWAGLPADTKQKAIAGAALVAVALLIVVLG